MARPAPKPRRNPLLPFYIVLGVVAVAGAWLLYRQLGSSGGTPATDLQPVVMTPDQLQRVPGISQGSADAPVTIMEFADFQCPGCGQFASFVKPLLKDHIDAGTVRFVWHDYPLVQIHDNAMLAARAGRCANEQQKFWPFHDIVFGRQSEWSGAGNAARLFTQYAEQAGLDGGAFGECLRSDRYQREVSESFELGNALGVTGTPTLYINNKKIQETPSSRADWDALIQQELGSAASAPAAAPPAATAPADTAP